MKLSTEYAISQTQKLLSIDSPTGFTLKATDELLETLKGMGFSPVRIRKGCVVCTLGGEGSPIVLAAHVDTLGLMVRDIQSNGRISFTKIGGPSLQALETETVRLYTRGGKVFTGVVELKNASIHVNPDLESKTRDLKEMEVLLDVDAGSKEEIQELGIAVGDFICPDPRVSITENGYIHSRYLDDKLSAGMLLALAKAVSDGAVHLKRKVTLFFSVFEEVGHGASAGMPADTEDLLVVDMGCVGDEVTCTERQVSICAKDSGGPYEYTMTTELIECAKENGVDYAVDVYPMYGSDAGTALRSGMDIRYALIGAGVYASHGYERSHRDGVMNTLKLIECYLCD